MFEGICSRGARSNAAMAFEEARKSGTRCVRCERWLVLLPPVEMGFRLLVLPMFRDPSYYEIAKASH